MNGHFQRLKTKIEKHQAHLAIVGLGYVGLPLAVEFAKAGFTVTGIDLDKRKIKALSKRQSYILDVPTRELAPLIQKKRFQATSNYDVLKKVDAVIVCVPTPLNRAKDPDMSFILSVKDQLKKHIHPGMLVILESTTYPGTTDEVVRPELESSSRKVGRDFFLCFSPERIDPSNPNFKTPDITKVVGGTTPFCTELGTLLYSQVVRQVHSVTTTRVAEMTKLIENTFRIVNIGLVNELAIISNRLGIDVWEAIDAASTKPFGYMPFYPGPGIGGHCIGIDPIYLSWKARVHGGEAKFIDLASRTNGGLPEYVVKRALQILNSHRKSLRGSRVLVVGLAYKKDVDDTRESPAFEILEELHKQGASLQYHDPFVPNFSYNSMHLRSVPLTKSIVKGADLVLIVTNHSQIDYKFLVKEAKLIFDTRNALKGFPRQSKIIKL